jgi:hypothetical protein
VNTARDHRLRVRFHTGLAVADGDRPTRRSPGGARPRAARRRAPRASSSRRRRRRCTAGSRSPRASGARRSTPTASPSTRPPRAGVVAVTLVRAVGELSRNDLPERPGHAGWPTATPEAQCAGRFAARFAVLPHGAAGPATSDLVERGRGRRAPPARGPPRCAARSRSRRPRSARSSTVRGSPSARSRRARTGGGPSRGA